MHIYCISQSSSSHLLLVSSSSILISFSSSSHLHLISISFHLLLVSISSHLLSFYEELWASQVQPEKKCLFSSNSRLLSHLFSHLVVTPHLFLNAISSSRLVVIPFSSPPHLALYIESSGLAHFSHKRSAAEAHKIDALFTTPLLQEFQLLAYRAFLSYWRQPTYIITRFAVNIIVALIFASAYANQVYETDIGVIARTGEISIMHFPTFYEPAQVMITVPATTVNNVFVSSHIFVSIQVFYS
jgi:hypothetical protein